MCFDEKKKHAWAAILDSTKKNYRNFRHVPLTNCVRHSQSPLNNHGKWTGKSSLLRTYISIYISPRWLSHYVRKYTYVLGIQGVKLTSANWTLGKHNIPYSFHQASPPIKHCPQLRGACQSKNIGERRPRISITFIHNNMMWCAT